MTAEDDIEGLAAEYVLGSLDPAERRQVAERRKTDAALDDAVKAWEQRLGPLAEQVPGIEPPPHLLESILSRISPQGAQIIPFSPPGKSRRGRTFGIASGALAACIALAVAWLISTHSNQPATLVAELHRPAGSTADASHTPAFVVTVDVAARRATVRPDAARARPGRSYQLWATRQGAATPDSLGIIPATEPATVALPTSYAPGDIVGATLAVSLEPEGGSPTGRPTGPIMFVGKLAPGKP